MSETMKELERIASENYEGHFAIMQFTTNWRVCFGTPDGREQIERMAAGKTFDEAAMAALDIEADTPRGWYKRLSGMPRAR